MIPLTEVSWLSVGAGFLFALFAFIISQTIARQQWKLRSLQAGFYLVGVWGVFETVDEFFVSSPFKEIIFNDLGRVILIIGLFLLIKEFDRLLGTENATH